MYWTDQGDDTIKRANLNGNGGETLVTGLSDPSGIALDVAGGKMYWTESGSHTIKRADLDGGNASVEVLVDNSFANEPQDLALDVANREMYWTDRGNGSIKFASMDGSDTPIDLITGLTAPQGIALDLANRMIYWTVTGSEDDVWSANLADGLDPKRIDNGSGSSSPHGMAIDGVNGKVYWVDFDANTIEHADLDGTNHNNNFISTGTNSNPRDIALGR